MRFATSPTASGDRRVQLKSAAGVKRTSIPAADPAAMVRNALEEPLNFPPLATGTVPGDHVAIAVDRGVPRVGEVVRGSVESFERAGINPEDISIVATDAETLRLCHEALPECAAKRPQFVLHDPDDNDNLCIVGHTKRHEPLLVNRTIFDADVVLPIGCAGPHGGVYDFLFPAFSNAASIEEFRTPANVCSPADAAKKTKEANEAGWLIGVMMTMQVVPGADETAAHVVAGEPQAVAERCQQLYDEQWSLRSPRDVSLVIANISGGAEAQNWQNVGRALATAENVLSEGGAVAICTNLDAPPGESLARLMGGADLEKTQRKILRDHAQDSVPAWHLARALQRGPVYFLSQLDPETVEELGLAPISNIDELARLAGRRESYIVIDDAQHAIVTIG